MYYFQSSASNIKGPHSHFQTLHAYIKCLFSHLKCPKANAGCEIGKSRVEFCNGISQFGVDSHTFFVALDDCSHNGPYEVSQPNIRKSTKYTKSAWLVVDMDRKIGQGGRK